MYRQILRRKKVFAELQELVEGGGQEDIAAAQMAADNDETKERFRPSLVSLSLSLSLARSLSLSFSFFLSLSLSLFRARSLSRTLAFSR